MNRTIIFDFDGTLAIGHGPVLAYAQAVATSASPGFVQRVEEELMNFDSGTTNYRDGYDIVATIGAAEGIPSRTMNQAYLSSRQVLGTEKAPTDCPEGLPHILRELSQYALLEVATNAPITGVKQVLQSWDVLHYFHKVHVEVGKPSGLYPIISHAQQRGPVLSVGDIVANDLQPAIDLGADTALVGVNAQTATTNVTMRGTLLTHLRESLVQWASAQQPSTTL